MDARGFEFFDVRRKNRGMTRRIHRVTPDSAAGRRMTSARGARIVDGKTVILLSDEMVRHNAEIDRKREEDLARRKARRGEK